MPHPTPPDDPTRYDDVPPAEAVARAWAELPKAHQGELRRVLPTLAHTLDRLTEHEHTPPDHRRPQLTDRQRWPALWEQPRRERSQEMPRLGLEDVDGGGEPKSAGGGR